MHTAMETLETGTRTATTASVHRGENFFEALFGFREKDYFPTRHQLFQMCSFETRQKAMLTGALRVVKERAIFEHPSLGSDHHVSSGWHSTPSVAELRTETAELVRTFEQECPGLLAALRRKASPSVIHAVTDVTTAPWVQCSHTVGESGALHLHYPHAFFQVASQFNILEFISPDVTPEDGVTHYVDYSTQGPACALACMAGTVYRNYLIHPDFFNTGDKPEVSAGANVGEQKRGQQAPHQLNLLMDFTTYLTQARGTVFDSVIPALDFEHFYIMHNGYFQPTPMMGSFERRLHEMAACQGVTLADVEDALLSRLRVGLVEDATVTLPLHTSSIDGVSSGGHVPLKGVHEVSQSYSSALSLPPAPSRPDDAWAGVALLSRIILRGTYEATLLAGVQHTLRALQQQNEALPPPLNCGDGAPRTPDFILPPIFLTKVGGGVFNNDASWIASAIDAAVACVAALGVPLDVRLVHHRAVEPYYEKSFSTWPLRESI